MNSQSIYLAILILLITATLVINFIFYTSKDMKFIVPISLLIITFLYVSIPVILSIYRCKTLPLLNNYIFKFLIILNIISISTIGIFAGLYTDNILNIEYTVNSSIIFGILIAITGSYAFFQNPKIKDKLRILKQSKIPSQIISI